MLVLIAGSFYWYGRNTEELVYEASRETARSLVETIIGMQHRRFEQNVEDKKSGYNFSDLNDDMEKGLASREYRWEFVRPVQEGPNMPRDNFEWEVVKQVPPTGDLTTANRPGASG